MALERLRATLGLNKRRPLLFLSQCNSVYTGLGENPTIFAHPTPTLPVLLAQIQEATTAQQLVGKINGASAARDAKFALLRTSMESERMMVQAVCDANPEQAAAFIAAARMKPAAVAAHHKELLALKNGMPSGTVLLEATALLLDHTRRRKTFNWELTTDGGKSYSPMPSTPIAKTSITGLTPLTMVGFRVSVTVTKQPQGEWSQMVSIVVR